MARSGGAIGQGFLDAGGRNVTITLQSPTGSANTSAIVGMVSFCQFWCWYPLAHCACRFRLGTQMDIQMVTFAEHSEFL